MYACACSCIYMLVIPCLHSFPPYAPENLFTDSQDRTIISFLRDEVEFICNSDCLLSFWIINDLYYYRNNPLPEGYVFHYPSTLIVDTIAASVNRTTYQCVACNTLSSTLTLHLQGNDHVSSQCMHIMLNLNACLLYNHIIIVQLTCRKKWHQYNISKLLPNNFTFIRVNNNT